MYLWIHEFMSYCVQIWEWVGELLWTISDASTNVLDTDSANTTAAAVQGKECSSINNVTL